MLPMLDDAAKTGAGTALPGLPAPDTRRWVARRKAQIVEAVRTSVLSFEDACRVYNISAEEFTSWERAIDRHGLGGLRVTRRHKPA